MGRKVITAAWTFDDESDNSDEEPYESNSDDANYKEYDSDYDSEEETEELEAIDDEEIRLLNRATKEPKLTPPRSRPTIRKK